MNVEECIVCYELYNCDYFVINCGHHLCFHCYSKLVNKTCPYCRQPLCITRIIKPKRKVFKRQGKINPHSSQNKKLNTFLSYRHFCNKKHDTMKEQKFLILKMLRSDV